jgi:hypothetical protein
VTGDPADAHPDGARMHRAANDPAFAARREAAFAALQAAAGECAGRMGLVLRGQGWAQDRAGGRATLWLQRDRYGWEVSVILRWRIGDSGDEVELLRIAYDDIDAAALEAITARIGGEGAAWFEARG